MAYQPQLDLLTKVVEHSYDAVLIINGNPQSPLILYANPAFSELTGYASTEVVGNTPEFFRARQRPSKAETKRLMAKMEREGLLEGESLHSRRNGEDMHISWRIIPVKKGKVTLHYICIIRDITGRKQAEETILFQARHDALTLLPNRFSLEEKLENAIRHANTGNKVLGILFFDLDRFKNINDTLGHYIGDLLLQSVAERLRTTVGSEDSVARLGGDEFIVLAENLEDRAEAEQLAKKIVRSLQRPFSIDGHELHVSASMGIACYPESGTDAHTLLRNADTALNRSKELGHAFQSHTNTMTVKASERLNLENQLRQALERSEFSIFYQPIIDAQTGSLLAAEALLRWSSETYQHISPTEFIPVAEEIGLISPLSEWILLNVCTQIQQWQRQGLPPFSLAINLSARQFIQEDLVPSIARVLNETDIDPTLLTLEVTESFAMQNMELTSRRLADLRRIGVKVSIDDFGTGHSSLNYLKQFPIDSLKIDRSFVRDCTVNPQDAAIVNAIIAMAHSLNLRVVAEGVESQEQFQYLVSLDCDAIQGFLISRPMDAPSFTEYLATHQLPIAKAAPETVSRFKRYNRGWES